MKKINLFSVSLMLTCLSINPSNAAEHHSGHGGGGGGKSRGSGGACQKAQATKFKPVNLTTVAPGSEFSFTAFNIDTPNQIAVNVKSIPVEVTTEDKDTFFLVKGKLPSELKNTTVRINIKMKSKISKCNGESGWLLNISG